MATDDEGVTAIRLWVDGQFVQEDETGGARQVQHRIAWIAPGDPGAYLLAFEAMDTAGQVSGQVQVLVSVTMPPTNTLMVPTPTATPYPTDTPVPTETPSPTPLPPCSIRVTDIFVNQWERSQLGCPISALQTTWAADQFFQHGYMLWRQDADRIYVFFDNDTVQSFEDLWESPQPECRGVTPPPVLYEPCRGFGKVWHDELGGPNAAVGWAVEEEVGFDLVVQDFERGMIFQRDRLGGTRVAYWDNGTWR
jgi:hypothetical protein